MRSPLIAFLLTAAAPAIAQPAPSPLPQPSIDIIHVQVILDHLGFSPGVIDGKPGQSTIQALRGLQEANGLPVTGKVDRATMTILHQNRAIRPLRTLAVTGADAAGPFRPVPSEMDRQAKLPALGYATLVEELAERFHTTPQTIEALNPTVRRLGPGVQLRLPNVLPASRDYPEKLKADWRQTLSDLNVNAVQPEAKRIVVDKSDGVLRVYDAADRLVAQFPATMGSEHDPLPIGKWTIKGAAYNPPFHYNPDLFWDADSTDEKALIKPGPNNPVGVVWIDLSKPHYGIHGTPSPEKIGRTESHGCIRLTNWDAARLSLMVKPGTPAVFQA